jgi:hypothetical protein
MSFIVSAQNIDAKSHSATPQFDHQVIEKLAHSEYFKLLLHYKKNFWGQERSESNGPEFFLSPLGQNDLTAELLAEITAFNLPNAPRIGPLNQHPQCAFPERFRFIREQTQIKFIDIPCPEFQTWKQHFKPRSLTLVYAAPYLGSPSSIFGHSFLRIDSREQALLDYGISFEAATGPDPGLLYALKGLTGFYPGRFSQTPYFLKVNTYTNLESRALWEYQLSLTSEEIDHMLGHVWEMGTTYFDYYFFNKNCSYHLLSMIEVAHPEFQLRSQFGPMAIPVDTIRALTKYPNAISSVHYRPALSDFLFARINLMTETDRIRFYELTQQPNTLDQKDGAAILDALLDWQRLLNHHELEQKLLLARTKFLEPSAMPTILAPTRPEQGHRSSKISLGSGSERSQQTLSFEFRPAIHDLLDSDEGYIPYSSLLIAQTQFSYLTQDQKIRLDQFQFAQLTNFVPMTKLQKSISWQMGARLHHPDDQACLTCLGAELSAGAGPSMTFFKQRLLLYSFAKFDFEYSNAFLDETSSPFRISPGLDFGVLATPLPQTKLLFIFEKPWSIAQREGFSRISIGSSFSFRNFQLRLLLDQILRPDRVETKSLATLGYYY